MMNKHLNVIIANAPINNGNRGCVALSVSSLSLLNRIFTEHGVNATFFLPDSAIRKNGLYSYHVDGLRDLDYVVCKYPPTDIKGCIKALICPKKYFDSIKPFKRCDLILDIGQGDSFADIYGAKRFATIDKIHKIARFFRKPYCLLPQTIGPFDNESIKGKAVKSILKASLVMARDEQSFNYVREIAPAQKNIEQYIDVAFFMPYNKIEQDNSFVHVGLNVSALLWNGGYTRNNQFGLIDDYKTVVRTIIDYFLSLSNVKVHLVPHVVLQERNIENDYEVSYELWREYNNPNLLLAPFAMGPIEIKSYIAGLDFFMGARMHATIAAFSSGVPVVPMAYSRKFNGLFAETLDYKYMIDLKLDSNEDIMMKLKRAFEQRNQLKEIIQLRLDGVVEEMKKRLCHDLAKFMQL